MAEQEWKIPLPKDVLGLAPLGALGNTGPVTNENHLANFRSFAPQDFDALAPRPCSFLDNVLNAQSRKIQILVAHGNDSLTHQVAAVSRKKESCLD